MERRPFSEVLKNAKIDFLYEYKTLFFMFYHKDIDYSYMSSTIRQLCDEYFLEFPIRDTFVSLEVFDNRNNFLFEENPRDFDINYLINFCEYSYNLVVCCKNILSKKHSYLYNEIKFPLNTYIEQVDRVIAKIGYIPNTKDNITTFVPRSQTAISVAEIIDPELSYDVIEYNHHSMKGDIERKRRIIEALSQKYAAVELCLEKVDSKLVDDLGFMLNNLNIRHNNEDPTSHDYHYIFAKLDEDIIEKWYDETYQLLLLAFLKHDNIDRREKIKKLKIELKEMDKEKKKNKKLQKNVS